MNFRIAVGILFAMACALVVASQAAPDGGSAVNRPVDFNREIQPILSDHCFACHGPDEKQRKAKLRFDTQAGVVSVAKPDEEGKSELLERILSTDAEEIMPPPKHNKPLSKEKIATLKKWVAEGAKWSGHWSLIAPKKLAPPVAGNPIDAFIRDRLTREALKPSPEAEKATWLRRVTFDLTGLPPSPSELDAFVKDASPKSHETVVDRLLASPRYGENMARFWLDAARYGDTHGLHLDNYREMWLYREWAIAAFNRNLSYDQFLTEQIAGDLLPNPTVDQLVATGFLRCHITTSEGGVIEEECYVRNVSDQVDTVGTVLFGLTIGCAKCHDHKYDPISQKDYYSMFAFFNSIEGSALDGNAAQHAPVIRKPTPEQTAKLDAARAQLATVKKQIADELTKVKFTEEATATEAKAAAKKDFVWIDDALPKGAHAFGPDGLNLAWNFVDQSVLPPFSGEKSVQLTAKGFQQVVIQQSTPHLRVGAGDTLFAYVYLDPKNPPKELMLQWHTNAWSHRGFWGENRIDAGMDRSNERRQIGELPALGKWVRLEVPIATVGIKPGTPITGWAFTQFDGTAYWDKAGVETSTPQGDTRFATLAEWAKASAADTAVPQAIRDIIKLEPAKRSDAQKKEFREYFIEYGYAQTRDVFDPLHKRRDELSGSIVKIESEIPASYIFKEKATPRPASVLKRGEYDQHGDTVARELPKAILGLPTDAPKNRLGFAQWVTDPRHPLTSRVAVNRIWQQLFGTGLVKSSDDFGTQGEPPSHPELLDWLAVDYRESGWDTKKLIRQIVLSATYRQSAKWTPENAAIDPQNRLLSRGPRFRLDAEMVRDQALFTSGLLVEKIGGPSVKPPQPAGLWEAVGYSGSNTVHFRADTGAEKVYRRSLYTFWKRTSPPPQMTALDAPSREACTVRRERTNTPLQALLLMNDTQFVEAARATANRVVKEGGTRVSGRVSYLFQLIVCRPANVDEQKLLVDAYAEQLSYFRANPTAAQKLANAKDATPELAAMVMLASLAFNLDETVTK